MQLTTLQRYALLRKFGVYAEECCDKCGRLIGAVRYTRKNEAGEWCSHKCRGSVGRELPRKGGRPPKYKNDRERRAAKTKQQQIYRTSPSVEKTTSQPSENKGITGAKIACLGYPTRKFTEGLKRASQ